MVTDKEKCIACGVCMLNCPKKAITIKQDDFGNKYPEIDDDKCIDCGMCKKNCYINKLKKTDDDYVQKFFAAVTKNNDILCKSSSGGVFSTLAIGILNNGGYVCGCSLYYENEKINIKHILIENPKDIDKLQGSKYVQSDIIEVLPLIKEKLNDDKIVLFSGTPCQVAALKSYLKKDYDNLYTVDIVCHGAPNQKIFLDYIKYVEDKYKVKITNVVFRDKKNGWSVFGNLNGYYLKNHKVFKKTFSPYESSYYYFFKNGYMYRPNCYKCQFACLNRPGDLTIGDYWGIEHYHQSFYNKKGNSCLIINTLKGENLIKSRKDDFNIIETKSEYILKDNSQLRHPTIEPLENYKIMQEYSSKGYKTVEKNFLKIYGKINVFKRKLKNVLKKLLKK